jgi:hypothetical protein
VKNNDIETGKKLGFSFGTRTASDFSVSFKMFSRGPIPRWLSFLLTSFKKMSVWAVFALAILQFPVFAAPVKLDSATLQSLPSSANFRLFAGNAPDDASVQTINPPVFKWVYYNDPWKMGYPNSSVQTFRFQLSADGSFATKVWDITTSNNFYNCLAPITNADGSTFTGTNYWRIVYMDGNLNVISTSPTHTFTVAPDAVAWDRSVYATTNFTIGFGSQHPHMFFSATNRAFVAAFLHTNSVAFSWQQTTQQASQTITQSWWNNDSFTNQNPANMIQQIANVCLTYQIDSNAFWKTANPGQMVSRMASAFMAKGYDQFDQNGISESSKMIPLCYDWAYDDMTSNQRSNVLFTMEKFAQFFVNADWWYVGTPIPPDRNYKNPLQIQYYSGAKAGSDHSSVDSGLGLYMTWAGMGESALLRDLQTYFLNYAIGQVEPFHGDQGRGYAEQSFRTLHVFSAQLLLACLDPRMTNNPWFIKYPKMLAYWEPLNYCELQSQFGDFGMAPLFNGIPSTQLYNYKYYDIAIMLQNGPILQQHKRNYTIRSGTSDSFPLYGEAFLPYYFPKTPQESDWPDTYYFDAIDGWCMSYAYPPNNWNCFTNGVGFILTARPAGSRNEHGSWHDGAIQIFAYGAQVTCGGIGYYYKHPILYPGLFVDGIGNSTPTGQNPTAKWYSRFLAFTNTPDYTYVGADLSQAFNNYNTNSFAGGGLGNLEYNYNYLTNQRPYISSVQRHVLFPHKKYLVIYDSFKTTTNASFQWKWNIMEPTAVVDTNNCSFTYTATNFFNGSNVTVYVKHIVDPAKMSMMNLVGTNYAVINPFTGENLTSITSVIDGPRWKDTVWVSNKLKTSNWHFLSVVYPAKWGQPAPIITRIDDYTVRVQDGTYDETITFGNTANSDYTVTTAGVSSRPAPPTDLIVVP